MKEYKLIEKGELAKFNNAVHDMLQEGWTLYGNPGVYAVNRTDGYSAEFYYQAFVR